MRVENNVARIGIGRIRNFFYAIWKSSKIRNFWRVI